MTVLANWFDVFALEKNLKEVESQRGQVDFEKRSVGKVGMVQKVGMCER